MLSRASVLQAGLATVLTLAATVVPASVAVAAPTTEIESIQIQPTSSGMSIALSAKDGSSIDLKREMTITLNPRDGSQSGEFSGFAKPAGTIRQDIMLAIDNSSSMQPNGITEAREAAQLFLRNLPSTVRVGLLIFANEATVVEPLTTQHGRIRRALENRYRFDPAQDTTSLYSAVDTSIDELGSKGFRDILLLSDGADDPTSAEGGTRNDDQGEARDWKPTLKRVRQSGIPITAIAFGGTADRTTLREYRDEVPGGVLVDAARGDLQRVFTGLAEQVSSRVVVDVAVAAPLNTKTGTVLIEGALADGQTFSVSETSFFADVDRVATPAPTAQAASQPLLVQQPATVITTPVILAALVALFLALAVIVGSTLGLAGVPQSRETKVLRRLSVYTLGGRQPQQVATQTATTRLGDNVLTRSAVGLVGRVVRNRRFDASIDRLLDAAGIPMRTAEWTLLHIGVAVGSGVVLLVLGSGHVVPALIGLLLGIAGPWIYLSVRRERRGRAFLAQLPDTLQLLAGSLQAGYSLPQAMDSIVREGKAPIASEFSRALVETRLGMPAEDALDAIAKRMISRDFSWIVMAIRIQREVGGNLAELLSSVAGTLRERERLRRQVRTLSAEGRLSGWILGLLPVGFALYLSVVQPEYLAKLYTPFGYILLALAGILLVVGGVWMSRVVKVEV